MSWLLTKKKRERVEHQKIAAEVEAASKCWWAQFNKFISDLTDYEQSGKENIRRITVAAEMADASIEQFEKRWGKKAHNDAD